MSWTGWRPATGRPAPPTNRGGGSDTSSYFGGTTPVAGGSGSTSKPFANTTFGEPRSGGGVTPAGGSRGLSTQFANTTFGEPRSGGRETPAGADSFVFKTPGAPISGRRRGTSTGSAFTTPTTGGNVTPARPIAEPLDRGTMMAIVEGRGQARGEIGIACMNIHTPTLVLCQFTDTQSYMKLITKVNIFRPYEILLPATTCDPNSPSQLYMQLQKEVPTANLVPIQRRIFNEGKGLQKIHSLVADEYSLVIHLVTNKYYCLSASAALLKYAELVHSMQLNSKTLKVEFQGPEQTCMIDHVTAGHLELLQNSKHPSSSCSVLGILNDCKTPVGVRLLRMSILQPPCDLKLINSRLDCIEELTKNRQVLYGLQDILGRLPVDIELVLATLIQIPKIINPRVTEQRINYMVALKYVLDLVPNLANLLENFETEYFVKVRADLSAAAVQVMVDRIKRVIQDEARFQKGSVNMKRQRCFAVRADVNPILDIARQAYCEIVDDINNYVSELSQQLNLPLRLGNSNQRGYYINFVMSGRSEQVPNLPAHFLKVRKRGNFVSFTTEVLISSDHRAKEIMKEIEHLSGIVIAELITTIRADISRLYKVSDAIGNLDLIYSLANYALTTPRCIRPAFSTDSTSIKMGRHPILDSVSVDPAVPNNTFLSNPINFALITGPNMSGKTTYIKQVATLQVLAQIGSYVPAEASSFRIAKNILSRLGTGDCIEENSSSFALELTEMKFILQNVCDSSLVIVDEFGRSTSVEEGAAMSWAFAEELLKTKAYVLFASHHLLLTKLESVYLQVLNYTMETQEWGDTSPGAESQVTFSSSKLKYTHVVKRGITDVEFYGLKLLQSTSYPPSIIENAFLLAKLIIQQRGSDHSSAAGKEQDIKRSKYLLAAHLSMVANVFEVFEVRHEDVQGYLESLQAEFEAVKLHETVRAPKKP